jgi:hypothetical protein
VPTAFLVDVPDARVDLADRAVPGTGPFAGTWSRPTTSIATERLAIRANTTLRDLLIKDTDLQICGAISLTNAFPRLQRLALHQMQALRGDTVLGYFQLLLDGLCDLRSFSASIHYLPPPPPSTWLGVADSDMDEVCRQKTLWLPARLESFSVLEGGRGVQNANRGSQDPTGRRSRMFVALSRDSDARLRNLVLRDSSVALLAPLTFDAFTSRRGDSIRGDLPTVSDVGGNTVTVTDGDGGDQLKFFALADVDVAGPSLLVPADLGRIMRLPRLTSLTLAGMRLDRASEWNTNLPPVPLLPKSSPPVASKLSADPSTRTVRSMRSLKLADCEVCRTRISSSSSPHPPAATRV